MVSEHAVVTIWTDLCVVHKSIPDPFCVNPTRGGKDGILSCVPTEAKRACAVGICNSSSVVAILSYPQGRSPPAAVAALVVKGPVGHQQQRTLYTGPDIVGIRPSPRKSAPIPSVDVALDGESETKRKQGASPMQLARLARDRQQQIEQGSKANGMPPCDVDTQQQMQQAEEFMRTIMDARAEQDAVAAADDSCTSDDSTVPIAAAAIDVVDVEIAAQEESDESMSVVEAEVASTSSDSSSKATSNGLTLPEPLEGESSAGVQWNLISPWSEADDEEEERGDEVALPSAPTRGFFKDCAQDSSSTHVTSPAVEMDSPTNMEEQLRQLIASEEKNHPPLASSSTSASANFYTERICEIDADEDDEEFEVFNVNTLVKTIHCVEELFEEKLDDDNTESVEDCTDGTRTSVGSTLDDSCEDMSSPRTSAVSKSRWGRIKANTYTGSASASMQNAYAKIRSRTLSTTTSFRRSSSTMEDDGDFSSDDEGYSKERVSKLERNRRSLVARLSSASSNLKASSARKMSLLRFRSSSATTTASEESFRYSESSFPMSPSHSDSFRGEAMSAPTFGSVDKAHLSQNQQQMRAQKLKASVRSGAIKAATYLNAASAEAARKIKSKTFRTQSSSSSSSKSAGDSEGEEPEPYPMSY
ncbi:hypothetical protein FI667_g9640, partial [Globisporangium splendens]